MLDRQVVQVYPNADKVLLNSSERSRNANSTDIVLVREFLRLRWHLNREIAATDETERQSVAPSACAVVLPPARLEDTKLGGGPRRGREL